MHDKKEEYIGFRITKKHFKTDAEAESFYETQRNLKSKSDFNRDSVIFMTSIEEKGNMEKFQKLMKIVELRGFDSVIDSLEKGESVISEKEVERIVLSILEKQGAEPISTSPVVEKQEIRKKPNLKMRSRI